jgi:HAD superfamily hydrolase (TIGR01509 family)
MRRFDAVIFDMDGVLIDSEPLHFDVLSTLLAADGYVISRAENEEFIGTTTEAMFEALVTRHRLPRSAADYLAIYDETVVEVLSRPHEPQPGVVPLIRTLRAGGIPLAVASSSRKTWIAATLRSLHLADTFDAIVSGEEAGRSKPDPAIYLLAAERLHVTPARCLAIEDAPNGVESARRAGMTVVGVRTPYTAHLSLNGVIETLDSLADLDLGLFG